MNEPRVASIHVGKVAPLGPNGVPSGFEKHGVSSAVNVVPLGIVGDEQADLRVHGGPDKAAYAYTSAHYAAWRRDYPQHTNLLVAGGPGENLSIDGMTLGSPHYMTCSQGDEMKWRRLLRKLRNRGKAM